MYIKKFWGFIAFILITNAMFAQMSDQQVIDYVTQANAAGASKEDIAASLIKRGVSQSQLERIKQQHESKQSSMVSAEKSSQVIHRERVAPQEEFNAGDMDEVTSEMTHKANISEIFGHNIFNTKNLTFAPSINIPTPMDYRLGPGDEVIIDIWGASQQTIRRVISPEGNISMDRLGPVYLNGMTIKEANDFVKRKFTDIYSTIDDDGTNGSDIKLTLGQIRTIQINVMGEAVAPGTYSLSSLASAFHALYRAGGVSVSGSLRSIRLIRNGKLLRTFDVYKYILDGKLNDDIRLEDNDVISVPPYEALVNISGSVKRPMFYEVTANETVADLLRYAGGFTGDAYTEKVRLTRISGDKNRIFTLPETDYALFNVQDKDVVTVSNGIDLYENRVEITGAIFRSGYYEIGKDIKTVKDLINAADGLRGDAFVNRAVLTREKDDYTSEIISLNLEQVMSGAGDIPLRENDILHVSSVNDLNEYGDYTIHGAVARPGNYKYADNTSLEDLLVQAGGLLESASSVQIDVARRIIDPKSTATSSRISENFTLTIKDGYLADGDKGFILNPYDVVYVRRSPAYQAQRHVAIIGEVLFPGTYALNKKNERLSDIIKRAKGLTPDAYPKGARLLRQRSEEEMFRTQTALKMARQGGRDSIAISTLDLSAEYHVGIELDKAVASPGSDFDIVLREGDRLIIPEYENTIKINGAVMYPNTVSYRQGKTLSYYIDQAGGYSDYAKKKKVYVIQMNGTVNKVKKYDIQAIQPGCEIIVPSKERTPPFSFRDVIGIGTAVMPIVSMAAIIATLFKK
ncbi:MAG: SLBB domain-containing protein [Prevotellaceae bacterium]|jgi:protein involved in polysaccharide export with SLBB domain|nr:SLBB domain-containing protein [Prevotellaceae bacterium]